jgi:hypothetical protein
MCIAVLLNFVAVVHCISVNRVLESVGASCVCVSVCVFAQPSVL